MDRKKELQTQPARPKLRLEKRFLRTLTDPDLQQVGGGRCGRSWWCRRNDES